MFAATRSIVRSLGAALPLAFLSAGVATAAPPTAINTVPYTITASGKYIVTGNLNNASTSTAAITVNAPNVQINLNGFYVAGPGNTASQNAVILVNDVANVTVRNGLISGDGYGIHYLADANSRNYLVENLTISRCYLAGVLFEGATPGVVIRNNSFSNIGGTTSATDANANAIYTGNGARIAGNSIANVTGTGTGIGIGINALSGDFSIRNTISNSFYGILSSKYLNNLTSGCNTPFEGGVNATGNN